MRDLYVSIGTALAKIEKEKGPFQIKCMIARDPIEPLWDLVLSADWFSESRKETLDFLADRVMSQLDYDSLIHFSGMVTYSPDSQNPLVNALRKIQHLHRQHRYDFMRADGMVTLQTQLSQARLVIPFDDESPSYSQEHDENHIQQQCA
ncbi:MAG: hypothetical protein VBE63_28170 [Lamprobacter sp.]|uniref:hypothetical protein n=1 Tax=Lamprobacter sp. TaxID=3100796 RepID=UPI002B260910|nr:hypothetical protein [Lamprobacter sp.]MEA3643775.1 hypothetical protein [Lamprobacter sp.]